MLQLGYFEEQDAERATINLKQAAEEDKRSEDCLMPLSLDFYMQLFAERRLCVVMEEIVNDAAQKRDQGSTGQHEKSIKS